MEHKDTVATQKRVVTRKALTIEVAFMIDFLSWVLHPPSLPAPKRTGFSPSAKLGVILFAWVTHVARASKRTAALKSSALAPFADRLILHTAKMRELLTIFRFPPSARQSKTLNIGDLLACDEQITLKPSGRGYCTSVSSSKIRATTSLPEADNSSASLQLL
jgi:hypothetical protein